MAPKVVSAGLLLRVRQNAPKRSLTTRTAMLSPMAALGCVEKQRFPPFSRIRDTRRPAWRVLHRHTTRVLAAACDFVCRLGVKSFVLLGYHCATPKTCGELYKDHRTATTAPKSAPEMCPPTSTSLIVECSNASCKHIAWSGDSAMVPKKYVMLLPASDAKASSA